MATKRPAGWVVVLLSAYGIFVIFAGTFTVSLKAPFIIGINGVATSWSKIVQGLLFMVPALGYAYIQNHSLREETTVQPTTSGNEQKTGFSIREDHQFKIETHVAGLCFRQVENAIQLLVGHRTQSRKLYPNLWECGGGQVHTGENFKDALGRQFYEEFGVKIEIIQPFEVYEIIHKDGQKIPGLVFFCVSAENGKEHITLNTREFSESQWITEAECGSFNMIPGIQKQATTAFAIAKKHFKARKHNYRK